MKHQSQDENGKTMDEVIEKKVYGDASIMVIQRVVREPRTVSYRIFHSPRVQVEVKEWRDPFPAVTTQSKDGE